MSKQSNIPAAERIMKVASDLFYRQGYRATGINEVIQKSGVAKATFYNHFPTKDDLCKAYLRELNRDELEALDRAVKGAKGPQERFLAVMQGLRPWLLETEFRGCGFLNMASEVPDPRSPLRKQGIVLYDQIRQRVATLAAELIESDGDKYGHLDARELTDDYMMLYAGAIMFAEMYHDIWPVEHALKTLRRLIGE